MLRILGRKAVKKGMDRKPSEMGATLSKRRWSKCFVSFPGTHGMILNLRVIRKCEPRAANSKDLNHLQSDYEKVPWKEG